MHFVMLEAAILQTRLGCVFALWEVVDGREHGEKMEEGENCGKYWVVWRKSEKRLENNSKKRNN